MFLLAFLYEVLKTCRDRFTERVHRRSFQNLNDHDVKGCHGRTYNVSRVDAFSQTLLQALSFTLAYLLMLVVMTYNVYLFLAVILGDAVGYYVTLNLRPSPGLASSEGDHCH